ncbi:hypothetical protein BVY04_00765, partial [bacterium M21]
LQLLNLLSLRSNLFQIPAYPDGIPTLQPSLERLVMQYIGGHIQEHTEFELREHAQSEPALIQLLAKLQGVATTLRILRRPNLLEEITTAARKGRKAPKKDNSTHGPSAVPVTKKGSSDKTLMLLGISIAVLCLILFGGVAVITYIYRFKPPAETPADVTTPSVVAPKNVVPNIPKKTEKTAKLRPTTPVTEKDTGKSITSPKTGSPLITDIVAATGGLYELASLEIGKKCYLDREYTFKKIPKNYRKVLFIRPFNDDKRKENGVSFQLARPATVYVAVYGKLRKRTDWLKSWSRTGDVLEMDAHNGILSIYSKAFAASPVAIPPIPTKANMHIIFVEPIK